MITDFNLVQSIHGAETRFGIKILVVMNRRLGWPGSRRFSEWLVRHRMATRFRDDFTEQPGMLLDLNRRTHQWTLGVTPRLEVTLKKGCLSEFKRLLAEHLDSTHPERAICLALDHWSGQ